MVVYGMLFFMKTITQKQALIGGVVIIVALAAVWYWNGTPVSAPTDTLIDTASTTDQVATTTPAPVTSKPKGLPPEPVFVLPEGATAIDDYAFIQNGKVYFRSLTGKNALAIPNSDAESFQALSNIIMFPGEQIVTDCGEAGSYAYYADDKQVYFYQFWRAPKFRSSTIEVIVGADMDTFKVSGETVAKSGSDLLKVSYDKATTTCKFKLSKVVSEQTD